MSCELCPKGTYNPERGSTACTVCEIPYALGKPTTSWLGTILQYDCLAPLYNFLILIIVVYSIFLFFGERKLRDDRDAAARAAAAERALPMIQDLGDSNDALDDSVFARIKAFFSDLKAYFSDLFLRYPLLWKIKVFAGRMMMGQDVGSDVLLCLTLWRLGECGVWRDIDVSLPYVLEPHNRLYLSLSLSPALAKQATLSRL